MGYIAGSDTFFRCVLNGIITYGRRNALMGNKAEKVSTHKKTKAKGTGREGLKHIIPSYTGAKIVQPQTPYNYCGLGYTQQLFSLVGKA